MMKCFFFVITNDEEFIAEEQSSTRENVLIDMKAARVLFRELVILCATDPIHLWMES